MRKQNFSQVREIVVKKLGKAHSRAERQYDLRRRDMQFNKGDLV